MTERVLRAPRKSRENIPPAQQFGMSEFNIIQLRAKQAAQFYNSVGLSNGDLPRDVSSAKSERKRFGSPQKRSTERSSAVVSSTFSQPSTPITTTSKYGATWLELSKPLASQETDTKPSRFKVLPSKYNLDRLNDSSIDKQRRKSSSFQHDEFALSPVSFRNQSQSTSEEGSSLEHHKNRLSPRLTKATENIVNSSESHKAYEKAGGSKIFKQDSANLNDYEKDARRSTSQLYEKQRSSRMTPEHKSKLGFASQPKRFLNELVTNKDRHTSSSNDLNASLKKVSDTSYNRSSDLLAVFSNSASSTPTKPFFIQRQRSLSDKSDRSSSAAHCTPSPSFVHSRKGGSTSSLLDQSQSETQLDGNFENYLKNKSYQSSSKAKNFKQTGNESSTTINDGGSPRSFRRLKNKTKSKSDVPDHRLLLDRLQKEKEAQEFFLQPDRFEQGQKQRRYFAHYDWRSALFSFHDAVVGMETLKRKNTPSGASKAAVLAGATSFDSLVSKDSSTGGSQEDVSVDADEGLKNNKHNVLVADCPFFRNEIGDEIERNITISASSAMSVQVGNENSEAITEAQNILPNHTYLSIVERKTEDDSLPPNSPHRGSVCFAVENVDNGAYYYRNHFYEKEHQNFFGIDDKLGPIIISFRREKLDEKSAVHQYRIIVRTCELRTLRGSILEDVVLPHRHHPPIKGYHAKDVLEYICPEINTSYLKVGLPTPKVYEQLMKIDEQNINWSYKVGVLYCKAGQTTEDDMYNNEHASEAFQEFLDLLGETVKLQGFTGFKGGLDVRTDSTGTESVFTRFHQYNIMFHVSTLLPFTPNNKQQLLRKRHIGNDIVTIVFQEAGSEPFNPVHIRSHFQHIFVIVRVHNPCTRNTCYSVAVTRSRNIPRFGPPIPENSMFPRSATFRNFLLTKVINGENTAHTAGKFKALAMNTREQYLRDLALNQATQSGMEVTPRLGRFSITAASRRIKEGKDRREKLKVKPTHDILSFGAIAWIVDVKDYSSSEIVPCLLAISNFVLSVIEIGNKQLIFSIPCQAVLGWWVPVPTPDQIMSNKRYLMIYYGRGERLSLETQDGEMRDEIVLRLQRFTKGSQTIYRQLRRNRAGELGFRVNYEGVLVDLKPDGCAATDGLKQSSRLVEICKIAVATLTSDEMNDLLRTASVVTVVVIPPYDDGTPRKCSMELYHLYPVLEVKQIDLRPMPSSGIAHERCRSEPVKTPLSDCLTTSNRCISEDGKFLKTKYLSEDRNNVVQSKNIYDRLGQVKVQKPVLSKTPSGNVKATLSPSASRRAMVGATSGYYHTLKLKKASENGILQTKIFNSPQGEKESTGHQSNHMDSDWPAGIRSHHTISNNSLSSDSGLNSNNNSSYSSTLSRCSNNNSGASNQQLVFNDFLETKTSLQNSNDNNSNNNASTAIFSLETCQTLPRSSLPIRGVLWKSSCILPNSNVSQVDAFTSSSLPYQSSASTFANSDSFKDVTSKQTSIRGPASLEDFLNCSMAIGNDERACEVVKKPIPIPRTFKKPPSPSPRTRFPNPKNKKTITDVPPSPGMMEGLRNSSTNPSLTFHTPSNVHSTIIQKLEAHNFKHTKSSTTSRESPVRKVNSQRSSPCRRAFFPSNTAARTVQRTISDESLCGARTDAAQLLGQETCVTLNTNNHAHKRLMSTSVDSLARSPIGFQMISDQDPTPMGRSFIHKMSLFPLPAEHNWDHLLGAAKAAEALEAASIRSVSLGTLNDLSDTSSHNELRKKTVSVEELNGRPDRSFQNTLVSHPVEEFSDLLSKSVRNPSEEEKRLEKIEKKLRQLQQQIREEQSSKKELQKEVSSLRRDNTLLLRRFRESNPNLFGDQQDSKTTKNA